MLSKIAAAAGVTCAGIAGLQLTCNLSHARLMDTTIDVDMSVESCMKMLKNPVTWEDVGQVLAVTADDRKAYWVGTDYTSIKIGRVLIDQIQTTESTSPTGTHRFRVHNTGTYSMWGPTAGRKHLSVDALYAQTLFSHDVTYTLTPRTDESVSGVTPNRRSDGCSIRKVVSNFEQKRQLLVPYASILRYYWLGAENNALYVVLQNESRPTGLP